MMQWFDYVTRTITHQAAEFAEAQQRVGSRNWHAFADPFALKAALTGSPPASAPAAGTDLRPPQPDGARPQRRRAAASARRRPHQGRAKALNFA